MDTLPVPSLPSRNIEMEKWTDTTNKTFVLECNKYIYIQIQIKKNEIKRFFI